MPILEVERDSMVEVITDVQLENPDCCVREKVEVVPEKEWVSYDELIKMFDFRGVKSAKDAMWRKKNGFDKCIKQAGGKGCAVIYSVSKVREWLNNESMSKKR